MSRDARNELAESGSGATPMLCLGNLAGDGTLALETFLVGLESGVPARLHAGAAWGVSERKGDGTDDDNDQ